MVTVRATCMLIALTFFVQVFEFGSTSELSPPQPIQNQTTPTAKPTDSTSIEPSSTTALTPATVTPKPTVAPETPTPTSATTTPTLPPTTPTTPTTPTRPTTPTTPTTQSTSVPPAPNSTTPTSSTTAIPPTPTPCPKPDRHFDGPSFMGGIILTAGLVAIGFILWKFYKARTERNYHTL